jgi:hypothetical protein
VDVEALGNNSQLDFYRWVGASADRLRLLDTSPALTINASFGPIATVEPIDWTPPLPAYCKLVVVLTRLAAGPATATFRVRTCLLHR